VEIIAEKRQRVETDCELKEVIQRENEEIGSAVTSSSECYGEPSLKKYNVGDLVLFNVKTKAGMLAQVRATW
jgi:hypothetical protein